MSVDSNMYDDSGSPFNDYILQLAEIEVSIIVRIGVVLYWLGLYKYMLFPFSLIRVDFIPCWKK